MDSAEQQREMTDFLSAAARNLREYLERDPAIRADESDAVVNRLPQLLRDAAWLLMQYEADEARAQTLLG